MIFYFSLSTSGNKVIIVTIFYFSVLEKKRSFDEGADNTGKNADFLFVFAISPAVKRKESILIVLRVKTKKLEKEARYMNNPIFLCAAHVIHKLKDSVSSIEKTVFIAFTFKI